VTENFSSKVNDSRNLRESARRFSVGKEKSGLVKRMGGGVSDTREKQKRGFGYN